MDTRAVTVLVGGWWLPGRALTAGETLTLDAATAEALARRGIVRIETAQDVAPNADRIVASAMPKTRRKHAAKEAE